MGCLLFYKAGEQPLTYWDGGKFMRKVGGVTPERWMTTSTKSYGAKSLARNACAIPVTCNTDLMQLVQEALHPPLEHC